MKKIKLAPLLFHPDDLEPIIDRETIETHYLGHHKGYVDKYNKLIKDPSLCLDPLNYDKILEFNKNGNLLHTMYWDNLIPKGSSLPSSFLENIYRPYAWGTGDLVQDLFETTLSIMGSGWGLLVATEKGDIQIKKIQNHDISEYIPICVVDFFEHSYYSQYKNNKKEFLSNFMSLINWDIVEDRLRAL